MDKTIIQYMNATKELNNALDLFMNHFAPLEHVSEPHPDVLAAFAAARKAKELL